MKGRRLLTSLALGLGIALALLGLLGDQHPPVAAASTAGTRYVATTGEDIDNDCTSSATPCRTIQHAVNEADEGDTIKVAGGVYTGVNDYGGLAQVVYISRTLTLRGGYTVTNWTTSYPLTQPTTLDARRRGRGLYITGDISATVAGLGVTGGDADKLGGAPSGDGGGGVYVVTATITLSDVQVTGNVATNYGGGIYNAGTLTLVRSTVSANATRNDCPICLTQGCPHGGGGGIDNRGTLALDRSVVRGNTTSDGCRAWIGGYPGGDGGGILNSGSLTVVDSTVSGNATGDGSVASGFPGRGGDGGGGGGICNRGTLKLMQSTVSRNATGDGGAGSGDFESSAGHGGDGGGVCGHGTLTILNSTFSSNTTGSGGPPSGLSGGGRGGAGGGLYLGSSDATLDNNLIADNQASAFGSGVAVEYRSTAELRHNTIARNSGGDGSGIDVGSVSGHNPASVSLTNTILVSHTVGIAVTAGSTATLDATLWGSGVWANTLDWGGAGTIITGTHNHWGDPAFVDPDAGDYHIAPRSAAIDAGVDTEVAIDIDGDRRPIGAAPDLGADEARRHVFLPLIVRAYTPLPPDVRGPGRRCWRRATHRSGRRGRPPSSGQGLETTACGSR